MQGSFNNFVSDLDIVCTEMTVMINCEFPEINFIFVLFCVVIIFMQRLYEYFFITIFYFIIYFSGMTAITEENSLSD